MDKWKLNLTVTSDDYQGLLDFMDAVKNWKRFKRLHYLDHTLAMHKGVTSDGH